TWREFEHPSSADCFREALRNPCNAREGLTAPYYLKLGKKSLSAWLRSGEAAIVNAVAYRAPGSPSCEEADQLPSVARHREWFRNELANAAGQGTIRVIVHRPKLWCDPLDQA